MLRLNDDTALIKYPTAIGIFELYDLRDTRKPIKTFKDTRGVFRISDHIVAIRYTRKTVKLYDLRDIKESIKTFKNIRGVFRISDHIVGIEYFSNNVEFYDIETKKVVWKKKVKVAVTNIQPLGKELIVIKYYKTADVFNWKKSELVLDEIEALLKSFVFGGNKLAVQNNNHLNIFFENVQNKKINDIKVEYNQKFPIQVRGNNIWIRDGKRRLKRFGPNLNLKKLNTQQLLLFMLANRSDRHPEEINNSI